MFGGALRTRHVARALEHVGDVTIRVVGSDAEDPPPSKTTNSGFNIERAIPAAVRPVRTAFERIRWAVDLRFLNVHGFVASLEDRARFSAAFDDYDLIWVQNARTPSLLQIWRWPHTHLDVDDLPSSSESIVGDAGIGTQLKSRARRMFLRRRELHYRYRFTTLSICSEADRRYVGGNGIHVIPNGYPTPQAVPVRSIELGRPRLGFIGLYSHAPNFDGVNWFLREVWPRTRAAVPGIRFRLIGRDTDGPLRPKDADVDALGWVADPSEEVATWSAMVVPIRHGGGTRIKIADGFSRKCPIVSTRHGAYGYEVEDRKQLRLVDDPAGFADACIELVRHPEIGAEMAERAWTDFLAKWTWDSITPKIHAAAEDCLRRSADEAAGRPSILTDYSQQQR